MNKILTILVKYHHLHRLLRHVEFLSQHKFLGFVDQHIFLNVHNLYLHKSWSSYIVLKHSHLNMCKGQELFTLLCLHPHDVWGVLGWFEILVWASRGILLYLYLSFRIRTTLNICKILDGTIPIKYVYFLDQTLPFCTPMCHRTGYVEATLWTLDGNPSTCLKVNEVFHWNKELAASSLLLYHNVILKHPKSIDTLHGVRTQSCTYLKI